VRPEVPALLPDAGRRDAPIFAFVLLLFDLEDVRGAAIAGEQIGAIVGFEERLQSFDAAHETDKIVLIAKRKTASIRSWRIPSFRNATFRRSRKKQR
jgi:hypothetical protein